MPGAPQAVIRNISAHHSFNPQIQCQPVAGDLYASASRALPSIFHACFFPVRQVFMNSGRAYAVFYKYGCRQAIKFKVTVLQYAARATVSYTSVWILKSEGYVFQQCSEANDAGTEFHHQPSLQITSVLLQPFLKIPNVLDVELKRVTGSILGVIIQDTAQAGCVQVPAGQGLWYELFLKVIETSFKHLMLNIQCNVVNNHSFVISLLQR